MLLRPGRISSDLPPWNDFIDRIKEKPPITGAFFYQELITAAAVCGGGRRSSCRTADICTDWATRACRGGSFVIRVVADEGHAVGTRGVFRTSKTDIIFQIISGFTGTADTVLPVTAVFPTVVVTFFQ